MQVDFYQLTRDPAEKVVPAIAQRVLDSGGRLLVISADDAQLQAISSAMWNAKPDSFLAHGHAGEGDEELQPILLSQCIVDANGAKLVALVDGVWRDEVTGFERVFYLFPPSHTDQARAAWRTLADQESFERRYWRQDGGKWVQGP